MEEIKITRIGLNFPTGNIYTIIEKIDVSVAKYGLVDNVQLKATEPISPITNAITIPMITILKAVSAMFKILLYEYSKNVLRLL